MIKKTLITACIIIQVFLAYSQSADEYFGKACTYVIEGNYNKAIKYFNKTIETDPEFNFAYLNRASVYTLNGDYKKAIADLNIYLTYDPENPGALESRGILLTETGNFGSALPDLLKASELSPESLYLNYYLGLVYFNLKDYKSAVKCFELYLTENQNDWESCFYIAMSYQYLSQKDKACEYSDLALNLVYSVEESHNSKDKKHIRLLKEAYSNCTGSQFILPE